MTDGTPKDLWFQYLTTVNDRALNRQKASGITTWAVAGLIAVLCFRSLDQIPAIVASPSSMSLHAISLAVIMDLSLFAFLLMTILLSIGTTAVEVRLESKIDRAKKPAVYVPIVAGFLSMAILNAISAVAARGIGLVRWPFVIFAIFLALQVIFPFVLFLRSRWMTRKVTAELPRMSLSTPFDLPKSRAITLCTILIISVLGLAVSLVPVFQAVPHITAHSHITIIKWAFQVSAILFMSLLLCSRFVGLLSGHRLEELERRIVLENLSSVDIRNLYVREFLGPTIQEWIAETERELKRIHDELELRSKEAEQSFSDLASVDRTMTYEISGRKEAICKSLSVARKRYFDYSHELRQKIEYLLVQKAFHAAPQLASQLADSWERQFEDINSRHNAICKKCHESTGEVSCTYTSGEALTEEG